MDEKVSAPSANEVQEPHTHSSPKTKNAVILGGAIALIVIFILVSYLISSSKTAKQADKTAGQSAKKGPTVNLVTEYNNPFDKKSQYVNPFSKYKNPFDTLK
ncbi:MAG: hypothetical protein HY431_01210 [Candidatus Levybacteria bacterium]|nr:hypothetical protein [Candidatus Levybacteria bacterium]